MWRAEIVTPWAGTGTGGDPNRPCIDGDYALAKSEDVTSQLSANLRPDPNLYVVRVECEAVVLDAIEADGDYLVLIAEETDDAIT